MILRRTGVWPACRLCLLAWLAFLCAAKPATSQSNTTAGSILLDFKAGISNWAAATSAFQGWTNTSADVCSWTGVACNSNNSVTSLSLQSIGLVGSLPEALGGLGELEVLNLASNQLTGTLPPSWGSTNTFSNLQQLLLTANQLNGSLPSEWGRPNRWPALASLQLGSNNLTGGMPASWAGTGAFTNLTALDLSANNFSGLLSPSWGQGGGFVALENLDLSNNSFTGDLPSGWGGNGSFPALLHLLLSNNSLTGSLPPAWGSAGRWPALTGLYLQNNQLSGEFPGQWHVSNVSFPSLTELLLRPGNSGLCGLLPSNTSYDVQYTSASGAAQQLTGTLGSCATACGKITTSSNVTNLFDVSVEAGVSLVDLLLLNPSANVNAPVAPRTPLVRPCYPNGTAPTYLGGNIAYGKVATQSSTVGNAVAQLAVASPEASVDGSCTLTRDGTAAAPAWWMLDLGASLDITGLIIAARTAVPDLKINIGDSSNATANAECSVGVQIEANATTAQECNGKGRYISLTRLSGSAISLCGVEVFPVAANAAVSKRAFASGGTSPSLATDGTDVGCTATAAAVQSTGAWLTVDLGYAGSFAAVGVDLGAADLMELNLRVGNTTVSNGLENPLCIPTIANLPGYSKTLFGCGAVGRFLTLQAPGASAMDLCLVSTFLQDAPDTSGDAAVTPSAELTLAPGPTVEQAPAPGQPPAPAPPALSPDQMVNLQFRLVLIGPYVVEFDGKEAAVVNALNTTLAPVEPNAIQITSYTVGAPVPASTPAAAPVAPSGRRLLSLDKEAVSDGAWALGPRRWRRLQQQVSEGAVIINVVVRTTAAKEAETIQLMQTSVASGDFTTALQNAGLDAEAVRFSLVPSDGAVVPSPAPSSGGTPVPGGNPGTPPPEIVPPSSSSSSNSSSSSGAAIGGGIAGAVVVLVLLGVLLWFWLARRRRRQEEARSAAAGLTTGGKGDIESVSDTGSSSGGAEFGGGNRGVGCWPLSLSGARPAGSDSADEMYGNRAFLAKGLPGSDKLSPTTLGQVHASARGANTPLASRLARGDASLRDAYSMPGTPGGNSASGAGTDSGTDDVLLRSHPGSGNALLLPAGVFVRTASSGILGSPSGWETPLGMGPGGTEGPGADPGTHLSPEQQMQMALGGPLGQLQRGVSDVASEVDVIAEDPPPQRWTAASAELWPITYRELTFLKQIGEGSFGRVYMARWRETTVAVKVLHRQTADHQDDDLPLDPCPSAGSPDPILHALQKEAAIMASVRHPNVISYLGVCPEPACIVTEYCSKGSLTDVLRRGRASQAHATALDWPRRLNMAMDAAKGMLHLHLCDPPIIHRDLKSPNLLVDKHWKLKVCDFNLSRVMEESVVLSSMVASNPRWLAPEILAGLPYTVAADVYSFGVIMWELLTWEVPWHQQNTWQVHAMVTVERLRPDIPAEISTTPGGTFGGIGSYLELMKACWAQDPEDRPDFETVIGRLRRMLAVETLARQPSVAGSASGSPSRHSDRPAFSAATASAPTSTSSPLAPR